MEEKWFGPVLFIPGVNRGRYPFCNSIYIDGLRALVDPGSDREKLVALLDRHPVEQVWLSHCHEDHIAHLDLFDHLPLWIAEEDAFPLSAVEHFMDFAWFEVSEEEKQSWIGQFTDLFHIKPRTPAGFLRGNETLVKNGVTVDIIASPGHTPGSLAFFIREPGVLFLADYDLTRFGPYYGDRESSIPDTLRTIDRLRKIPAQTLLTGHEEGVFEHPEEAPWERYLEVIATRENKLLEFLKVPRTLPEIVGAWIAYGKPHAPQSYFEQGERVLMKKHLQYLLEKKLITYANGKYVRR
jgi:glyoxylase-like metal-dependent hydrolase (beta-lactamase superfamily II)